MKYSIFSIALVAACAAAQDLTNIPSCATSCITQYTTGGKIAGCAQLDIACVCNNKDFLSGIACCLTDACDPAGQDAAVQYAKQICSSQGISTPDKVVCNKNSASSNSTATASPSSSGTTTTASGSSATSTNAAAPLATAGSLFGAAAMVILAAL